MQHFQVELVMSENTSILEDLVQQIVISAHMVKNCLAQKVLVAQIPSEIASLKAFFSFF